MDVWREGKTFFNSKTGPRGAAQTEKEGLFMS